jgi:hypothetical protein
VPPDSYGGKFFWYDTNGLRLDQRETLESYLGNVTHHVAPNLIHCFIQWTAPESVSPIDVRDACRVIDQANPNPYMVLAERAEQNSGSLKSKKKIKPVRKHLHTSKVTKKRRHASAISNRNSSSSRRNR